MSRYTAMNVIKEVDRILVARGDYARQRLRQDLVELLDFFGEPELTDGQISWRSSASPELLKDRFLARLRELHGGSPIDFLYETERTTWHLVGDVLQAARDWEKEAAVAKHLVAAILTARFPDRIPSTKPQDHTNSLADDSGDFRVGDTIFHVTVAPMLALFDKCKRNLADGYRVYVLVPERVTIGARQNAEQTAAGKIHVVSIESFVSQNIEELAEFSADRVRDGFYRLFNRYNERVNAIENDKSLLLEVPRNLLRRTSS